MLPRIILHNAVNLDGRIDGFPVDLQQYYTLVAAWKEDATLAGSGTFLKAATEAPPEDESAFIPPEIDPGDHRAILIIPDSRGRIRTWHYLRSLPYWCRFVALCSKSTPRDYLDYLKRGISTA
jgi:2,5-diamino-6-(ribosylamino)-4(3H)-pyrimidinone 5'-phosphate reductase